MGKKEEDTSTGINYTELAVKLIDAQFDRIIELLKKAGEKLSAEAQFRLTNVFKGYISSALTKYGTTKTFLYRNQPVPLYDFYVPIDLQQGNDKTRSAGIVKVLQLSRLLVVTGLAGIGKSTFLKHLFLDAIKHSATVPVFVELRHLNEARLDLLEHILSTIQAGSPKLPTEFIERAFRAGQFTLLLDAYDEVAPERRESIRKGIRRLADQYPSLNIILTSRPDDEFAGWTGFSEHRAMPMSKQQALALLDKLDYDFEVKDRFMRELNRALFEEHESFLSNPLLLTIMLLTYRENAEIPKKRHLFFSQVFLTLYSQHDALKEGYKRPIESGLALDDFQRALAAVSVQSFLDGSVVFSRESAIAYIRTAKDITELSFNADAFLTDLLQAVCLLVQDGLFVAYTHRQFQEYYTAVFVAEAPSKNQGKLIKRVCPGNVPNDVIKILHELNQDVSERQFLLPAINSLFKKVQFSGEIDDDFIRRMLRLMVRTVGAREGGSYFAVASSQPWELLRFIRNTYRELVSQPAIAGTVSGKALTEYVLAHGEDDRMDGKELDIGRIDTDPAFFKVLKTSNMFRPEFFKWIVDVRDFLKMRQSRRTKSIEELLK